MIHIVFQTSDIEVLQEAMKLDPSLEGEVVEIKDEYAVGPLQNLYETEGYQQRRVWWKELVDASPYKFDDLTDMVNDRMAVHQLKKKLEENSREEAWIWMGQNTHDVCGYYWFIGQLKEFQGRVFVLYMNNLPFINEKGAIFYPTALHQIQPKEFLKAKKLCRKVTGSEMEVDPDEWNRLMMENATVRILEGGKKIAGKGEDHYDKDIIAGLTKDFQKGYKAMHNILAKMKAPTGDVFLLWRMKAMAEAGAIELNGDPSKGWKEFEVRLKSEAPAELPAQITE